MTMTSGADRPLEVTAGVRSTARATGLPYLAFFVVGILGTVLVRGRLFDADDPALTLSNLQAHELLARVDVGLELAVVLAQALTVVGLFRLFRRVDPLAAAALLGFGLVNATAILASAAALGTSLDVAGDASLAAASGQAATVQLMYVVSGHLWGVGALFFGLWLIPMGRLATLSTWFPRWLGPLLVVAGVCYVLSAFVAYLFSGGATVALLLTLPSVAGELWMTGYLVVVGVRSHVPSELAGLTG